MSMIPSSPQTAVGHNPKSSISFASGTYWFRMKLNEGTGTSVAYTGKLSSGAISGSITIPGTTANLWTQMPNLEAQGDNAVNMNLDLSDIVNTTNLEGTILIMLRVGSPTVPSANTDLLSIGAPFSGSQGINFQLVTSQRVGTKISDSSGLKTYTPGSGNEVTTVAGETSSYVAAFYRDSSSKNAVDMTIYNKGILTNTAELTSQPNPIYSTLLGRGGTQGNPAASGDLEVDQLMSDILMVRTSIDIRSSLGTIAMEHQNNQFEMLRTLESLGV